MSDKHKPWRERDRKRNDKKIVPLRTGDKRIVPLRVRDDFDSFAWDQKRE